MSGFIFINRIQATVLKGVICKKWIRNQDSKSSSKTTGSSRLPVNTARHPTGTEHSLCYRQMAVWRRGYNMEVIYKRLWPGLFGERETQQAGTVEAGNCRGRHQQQAKTACRSLLFLHLTQWIEDLFCETQVGCGKSSCSLCITSGGRRKPKSWGSRDRLVRRTLLITVW